VTAVIASSRHRTIVTVIAIVITREATRLARRDAALL
jgi:hypothetical protein